MTLTTFAAIDIGSYETEMVIYEIGQDKMQQLDHVRHTISLGRDAYNTKSISYPLVDELCEVLYGFVKIMKTYKVKNYRAVATSAIREAGNCVNILDRIKVVTGLKVEILSNSEQRLVMYEAVASKKEGFSSIIQKGAAMADVGSGSTQVSLFDNGSLITTQNICLGGLRIRERIDSIAADSSSLVNIMEEYIDTDIEVLKNLFIRERKIKSLIAVGDNINRLMRSFNPEHIKEYYTRDEFIQVYHRLYYMGDIENRQAMPEEVASAMLPSIMIYKKIMDITQAETIWIPGVKLCDGLALEYAVKEKKADLTQHDFNADIIAAARNITKRYSWNKEHVKFVEKNALAVFDTMKKVHGLGKRERLILQIACILHDCGQYISMTHPEECSYNIVMSTEIIGLSHTEREMTANIIKYTTMDFKVDDNMAHFSNEVILTISKLTAIIKICNALDRGHRQKFKNTTYSISGRKFQIITETYEDITLEKGMISDKISLFEEVYGLKPVIIQKKL